MMKITKKEFVELLCSSTTAMIVCKRGKKLTECDLNIIRGITSENCESEPYRIRPRWRNVEMKQTNALKFSNQSWLYFDNVGEKRYYRVGDTVLQITTDGDYTLSLGYLIKR